MKFNAADATVIAFVIGTTLILISQLQFPQIAPREAKIEFYKDGERV